MSFSSSTVRSIADYLKHFFGKQFGLSQKITLKWYCCYKTVSVCFAFFVNWRLVRTTVLVMCTEVGVKQSFHSWWCHLYQFDCIPTSFGLSAMSTRKKVVQMTLFGTKANRAPIHRNPSDFYQVFVNSYWEVHGQGRKEDAVNEAQRTWKEWDKETKYSFVEQAKARKATQVDKPSNSCRWLQECTGSGLAAPAPVNQLVTEQSVPCEGLCDSPSVASSNMSGARDMQTQAKQMYDGL